MAIYQGIDDLGISAVENASIDALEAGATREQVSEITGRPIEEVPEMILPSDFDEEKDLTEDFEPIIPKKSSKVAAKQAVYGSLISNDLTNYTHNAIYNELSTIGESPTLESLKDTVRQAKSIALRDTINSLAREGNVDNVEALLASFPAIVEDSSGVRLTALENASQGFTGASEDPRVDIDQEKFLNSLYKDNHKQEVWNSYIDAAVANSTSDMGELGVDLIDSTIVGEQLLGLSSVAKDIFGERYYFETGTMIKDLSDYIKSAPSSEESEKRIKEVVDSFSKHAGTLGTKNDLVKVFALEDLREYLNSPTDRGLNTFILNVAGYAELLNVIGVGGVASKLIKGLSKTLKSSSSMLRSGANIGADLQKASPTLDAKITTASLEFASTSRELGTTQAETVARTLPSNYILNDMVLEGAPKSVKNLLRNKDTLAQETEKYLENTFIYKDADYLNKEKKVASVFNDNKDIIEGIPSMSTYTKDPDSNTLNFRVTYGDETDLPLNFEKASRVSEKIKEVMRINGYTVEPKLFVKDEISGNLRTYDEALDSLEDSRFFVNVEQKVRMTPEDIVGDELHSLEGTRNKLATVVGSDISSWILDPQSYISKSLLGAARVSNDAKFYTRNNLLEIAEPFYKLNWSGKKRVADLLNRGEEEAHVWRYSELEGKYSQKEIEAYYSARMLNDTVYSIKNADTRTRLLSDGYKGLSVEVNDKYFKNAVKIVENPEQLGKIKYIFNPRTGDGIKTSFEEIQRLKNQGFLVGQLLRKADKGNEAYTYALVKGEDVYELPANVFPYKEGYNFRVNNDPYFITQKTSKKIDGEITDHVRTVGVARDIKEAQRYLESLKKADKTSKYEIKIDRNISSTESALKADMDTLDGSGLHFWFSERGDRLLRIDGSVSSVQDPLSSMTSMISATANVHTHREFIEAALTRHRKTYGNIEVNGNKLWRWDSATQQYRFHKEDAKTIGRSDVASAVSEYNYLENLMYAPTGMDIRWKHTMEGLDRLFGMSESPLIKGVSKKLFLEYGMSTTPGKFARGAAFNLTIPLRPIRHLVLQGLSGLHLTGIDPKAVLPSLRDGNILMLRFAAGRNSDSMFAKAANKLAVASGYTEDEWNTIFEAFNKSGKGYSIDSNVMVGEANFTWARSIPETALGEAGRKVGVALKSPFTLGKKLGFDLGEFGNQALTFMFAVKRWQKANPGKKLPTSKREWDTIYDAARNFSIDMTKTSAFGYQRGAFASMTQFMAINHKMALNILGANPAINVRPSAQAAYIGGLLAMYGTAGVGLQDFYDSWSKELDVDLPPEVDDAMYGGFVQALFNKSLQLAFGTERGTVRTAISDSISPSGGVVTFPFEFVKKMVEGNFLEAIAGPSANIMPNVGKAASYVKDVWGFSELDTTDKLVKSFQLAYREFGIFSDMYKLNMAMAYKEQADKLYVVSRDGRPTAEAKSWQELYSKALLGLNLRSEQELYTKWKDAYQEVRSSGKKFKAQIDKDAEHVVRYMYEAYAKYGNGLTFREKMLAITYSLHRGDRMYSNEVYKAAYRKLREHPMFENWALDMIQEYSLLNADADFNQMRNAARHSDAIPQDKKDIVLKAIDALEVSSEAGRELINETDI